MIFLIFSVEILEVFLYFIENKWNTIELNLLETLTNNSNQHFLVMIFCDCKKI